MNNERGNHVSGGHPACRHRRRRRRGAVAGGAAPWPTCLEYFTSFTSFCFCYLFFCLRRLERISLSWLMNKRGKTSGRRLHNSFSLTEGGGEAGGVETPRPTWGSLPLPPPDGRRGKLSQREKSGSSFREPFSISYQNNHSSAEIKAIKLAES